MPRKPVQDYSHQVKFCKVIYKTISDREKVNLWLQISVMIMLKQNGRYNLKQ